MKFFGVLFAIMALVFAVVSGMSTGANPAALKQTPSAGCNGRGPPPAATTAATTTAAAGTG